MKPNLPFLPSIRALLCACVLGGSAHAGDKPLSRAERESQQAEEDRRDRVRRSPGESPLPIGSAASARHSSPLFACEPAARRCDVAAVVLTAIVELLESAVATLRPRAIRQRQHWRFT
jgi:hypothetical protein